MQTNKEGDFFMRDLIRKKIKVITDEPMEFEERVNDFLEEMTMRGAETNIKIETNPLIAIIEYEETILIPETISDKYDLRGMKCHCEQCEHFTIPDDKRRKRGFCELHQEMTWKSSSACDEYYMEFEEEVEKGGFKLRD